MGTVRLQERIAELARQRATAVSLRDLWKHGHKPSPSVRLQNAIFLQHELPIRMAQRIEELRNLPFGLAADERIEHAARTYEQQPSRPGGEANQVHLLVRAGL